jgi:hypothetical protein
MIRKYLIISVAVISAISGAYFTKLYWSNKYNSLIVKLEKAEKENMQHILSVERLQRDKADAIASKLAAEESARQAKSKVITKEVVKYVESNSNSKCELDDDWVHISDSATPVPRVTETSSETDGTSNKIRDLGDALEVVTNNYSACQDAVDRLQAWQQWYKSISE